MFISHAKSFRELIFILFFLFSLFYSSSVAKTMDQKQIWQALQSNVNSLQEDKKYSEALSLLRDFERQAESSSLRAEVKFRMATLLLKNLNQIEKGFNLLEESAAQLPETLHRTQSELKSEFARPITQKRLNYWNELLIQFFAVHLNFPEDLHALGSTLEKKTSSYLDGFGFPLVYRVEDNLAFVGKDKLKFSLLSVGQDAKEGTEDDLRPEITDTISTKLIEGMRLVDTFRAEGTWGAEITFQDSGIERTQKIKEGETILDYKVFGILDDGVVLIKDRQPIVLRK